MHKPKILVSSTCYDLGEIRNKIKQTLESLNYKPVLSDQADILYNPNEHTHTSCIKAVDECDMLILIISERFGGKAIPEAADLIKVTEDSSTNEQFPNNVKKGILSISQAEVMRALDKNIPIFTFISSSLVTLHKVYEKNKQKSELKSIEFPPFKNTETASHVFEFYNYIRLKTKNNAVFPYTSSDNLTKTIKRQFAKYFGQLLKEKKESVNSSEAKKPDFISASVVNNTSKDRTKAFHNLLSDIDNKDQIKILGTGITSFLARQDEVEQFLKDENEIQILLVNEEITKKDWSCTSKKFLDRLNLTFVDKSKANKIFTELETKTHCPLADLNFLVDTKHFNNYYAKENYVNQINESYALIEKYISDIEKNNWKGTLEVKHFNSFVPISITAIFPDHSEQRKLLAEFIIPFTENRIMLKSSLEENPDIYKLFIDFFDETWNRAKKITFPRTNPRTK